MILIGQIHSIIMPSKIELFLENPQANEIIFYPRKIAKPTNLRSDCQLLELNVPENIKIGGLFYLNSKELPTLLIFHGNGEIATDYEYGIDDYKDCGLNCAIVDFRGYGFSTGTSTYKNMIEDANPIYHQFIKWLEIQGYSEKLYVMGRSLGSACAAEIGSYNSSNIAGIIFESGFCDTYQLFRTLFMLDHPDLTFQALAPWSNHPRIAKIQCPVLILHGTQDNIVPFAQGQLINATLPQSTPRTFIAIEKAGHNNIQLFKEKYFTAINQFVSKMD